MAEKVQIMPIAIKTRQMTDIDAKRLRRRREALEALRKQTKIAENRLRWDIFNTWRVGGGTMKAIAEAAKYQEHWVWQIINRIRNNDKFLQMAVDEYAKENPDAKSL